MSRVTYHTGEKRTDYVEQIPPREDTWAWVTGNGGDVHVFEDSQLPEHVNFPGKKKVACIVESPAIYDYCKGNHSWVFHPYQWIRDNHQHFDVVMSPMTFLKDLVGDRYWWVPAGGNRIDPENFGLWEKERLLSIVASDKQWTEGHKLRHQIVQKHRDKMDVYGRGFNDLVDRYDSNRRGKILALGPYYYSLAIMNSVYGDYFTEILTDVLACGTIPIFWGTTNIGKYFNPDGIIQFQNMAEFEAILPTLTPELYHKKMSAIVENIEKAKAYNTRFDWIYDNYRDKLEAL
jgi:hypothetical protein